jgi:hypothetical protein
MEKAQRVVILGSNCQTSLASHCGNGRFNPFFLPEMQWLPTELQPGSQSSENEESVLGRVLGSETSEEVHPYMANCGGAILSVS